MNFTQSFKRFRYDLIHELWRSNGTFVVSPAIFLTLHRNFFAARVRRALWKVIVTFDANIAFTIATPSSACAYLVYVVDESLTTRKHSNTLFYPQFIRI
ncbi:uncharacterized protein C8R40DRAFT_1550 [Lentinula edodes]|uniref:uncharacterized protein n=1 Tax=Lentinula edodes TaxID=5353 RepID=UPI001E8CDF17|nr:uncharacterized protein C8R40DRAFT_1550 [Lentinula edodes]KAH7880868.1 hypothetical protein C8R40DRAFT_1550 [Lentinula edodes]